MIVIGIGELLRILQDLPHARHQLIQELAALRIVEQRPPDAGNLHQAGQGEGWEAGRQRKVQVEEELEGGVFQEGGPPGRGNLHGAEVVGGFVGGGADEIEGETVVGQAQQLGEEAVLGRVVKIEVFLKEKNRKKFSFYFVKKVVCKALCLIKFWF